LMTNHFHLLVHCPDAGLSESMQWLESAHARWINGRYERDGPLFRGRFRSVLVESDAQLVQLSRYIHRNPLSFLARDQLASYRWSSYGCLLGRRTAPDWLVTDAVAAIYGSSIDELRQHVESDQPGDRFRPPTFVDVRQRLTLDELDTAIERETGITIAALRRAEPGRSNPARLLALAMSLELRIAPAPEVAAHYGMRNPQTARNHARRGRSVAAQDAEFAELRRRVLRRLDDTA